MGCLAPQPWSPGQVVSSKGIVKPSSNMFVGAFSIELEVDSEDPSWSADTVEFKLPSTTLIPGVNPSLALGARAAVVHAKDADMFEVLVQFPHEQLAREGEEVRKEGFEIAEQRL